MNIPNWKTLSKLTTREAATWLFVVNFLTIGIGRDHAYLEWLGLLILTLTDFVLFRTPVPRRAVYRTFLTAAVLTLITGAYLTFGSWPSSFGIARSYNTQAIFFVITYLAVGAFAALFFEERLFERVIWRASTIALWVGVLSCLASRLTHQILLTSASHGALRMQGTLSEPSAWAPVITLVVLLAIRRRAWWYLPLAAVGEVLAASPVCLLVLLASAAAYYVLTGTRRQRVAVVLLLAAFLPPAVFFAQTANRFQYLNSHNTAEVTVGRLLSGIKYVETDGRAGHNTRFADTTLTISQASASHWLVTGAGPAADETYFPAKFPSGLIRPNALWVSVLFDFGIVGVVVLAALMLAAAWRMRHFPQLAPILLPFFITALINSAEGSYEYAFVALGILLFAFGWAAPPGSSPAAAGAFVRTAEVQGRRRLGVSRLTRESPTDKTPRGRCRPRQGPLTGPVDGSLEAEIDD